MSLQSLLARGAMYLLLLPAIILHEVSHGYVAYLLGDTTAKDRGRLSLNPLRHIDPWGTVLLPILMVLAFGFGFGYAKPVPINPNRFKNFRHGMFLTGIAGPVTNLLLAGVSGAGVRVLDAAHLSQAGSLGATVGTILYLFCAVNLSLMFFNLIPLPPLDGSRVLPLFLSDRAMRTYARVEQYGFMILIAVLWVVPQFLKVDPIGAYFNVTVYPLLRVFAGA